MKRKKLLKLLSVVTASAIMLAGCGGNGSSSGSGTDASSSSKSEESNAGSESTEQTAESGDSDTEEGDGASAAAGSITYPLNSDLTVSWYAQDGINPHEKFVDATESPFHIGLAENLGVNIEWSFPTTGADANTFTSTLMADPMNLPDIMVMYAMNNANQYIEDEVIWDLTDYIQEYAPDYYAWLKSNPAYDQAMKTDNGQYYAFGFFREDGGWNDTYLGPVVRTDWLEECGLEIPKTISEFENVVRVFNEKYGAYFNAADMRFKSMGFSGSFGAYGGSDATWGWYVKDGKVGFGPSQPEWREYLKWLNKMWEDGLIDQDMTTEDDTTIKTKIHNDKCGISYTSMGQMNNWNNERVADGKEPVWAGIPWPTGDDGTLSAVFGGPGIGTQTTVITKCADEETMKLCLQMLNYSYTEEGMLYWNYGTEGVSWEYDENGVPAFTSLVTDDKDTDPMTKYNGSTWSGPDIQATNLLYLKNSEAAIEANNTWFYIYDDEEKNLAVTSGWKWPTGVTFTTAEADELDQIAQNIPTYVSESYTAFMKGDKDVDDDAAWQEYLDGLESYNLTRILEIRQDCYDRYLAR